MHPYRTHNSGALRASDVGATARISGWVHRKRDHGNLLFVDLRDHFGITQCVVDQRLVRSSRPKSKNGGVESVIDHHRQGRRRATPETENSENGHRR